MDTQAPPNHLPTYLDALLHAQDVEVQQQHDAVLRRGVEEAVEELALSLPLPWRGVRGSVVVWGRWLVG